MQTRGIPDNQYSPREIKHRLIQQWRIVVSNHIDNNIQVIKFYFILSTILPALCIQY